MRAERKKKRPLELQELLRKAQKAPESLLEEPLKGIYEIE